MWDFGAQEIYHATHQFFLTQRSLYVLVDDTRSNHKSAADEGFRYWLELIDVFGGHSPVLIFQNEKGGRSKAIDLADIKGKYDNVKDCYSGNLELPGTAEKLAEAIELHASHLSHIGEELPAKWLGVRSEIQSRAEKVPFISIREYYEIYDRHLEPDRTKALHLSRYLHDLGGFLHFQDDPLLSRTVILQNTWATEAVYRILDDELIKEQHGRFRDQDCKRLWQNRDYADMQPELLALMQRFELCYQINDVPTRTWLAPQLFPPNKPPSLASWATANDLVLRYQYGFLPKGLISRLTVRLHRYVHNPDQAWERGVLFRRDTTEVLVEVFSEPSTNIKGLEVRARGIESKALLSIVAADIDALNDSFRGLGEKVSKRIPCRCSQCKAAMIPEFFDERHLLRRKADGKMQIECPRSYQDVAVLELIDGVQMAELPAWAKQAAPRISQSKIQIFLASSAELRSDRDAFDLYFRRYNDQLRERGRYLEIIRWEYFLDAVSETRLQNEYNRAIERCDVFVSLFFTKAGRFTQEEFDAAYGRFRQAGRPRVYTYFKDAEVKVSSLNKEDFDSLRAFKDRLAGLGHFPTSYENVDQLLIHFQDQLVKLFEADDALS